MTPTRAPRRGIAVGGAPSLVRQKGRCQQTPFTVRHCMSAPGATAWPA